MTTDTPHIIMKETQGKNVLRSSFFGKHDPESRQQGFPRTCGALVNWPDRSPVAMGKSVSKLFEERFSVHLFKVEIDVTILGWKLALPIGKEDFRWRKR